MIFSGLHSRTAWVVCLVGIIAVGIASRIGHTGLALFDKHLGDALYAAMIYVILRLIWQAASVGLWAMAVMVGIELFQLTGIAAEMLASPHWIVRTVARLMGTQFSFSDLFVYAVGIGCIYLLDGTNSAP